MFISYDSVGNPLSYKGNLHSWTKGRLLQKVTQPVNANMRAVDLPLTPPCYTSFEYNASGIRTKKVNFDGQDTITTEYKVEGTTILQEKRHSDIWNTTDTIRYIYNNNELTGFEYNGLPYYYRKNLFGDIVEIYDDENQLAASYTYDAWGNFTVGTNVDNIANVNPFRYRGYYYDWETRYYYLQTRYYDPETGRFINADSTEYLDPETINGCNLFAYGLNNPIKFCDPTGKFIVIALVIGMLAGAVVGIVSAENENLTGGEYAARVLLGIAIGVAVAGAVVATVGVVVGAVSGITAAVGTVTAAQAFAIGSLVYNSISLVVSAIAGITMQLIEYEPADQPSLPGPQRYVHPYNNR